MALNKVYVFTGVVGGAGDGTSLVNAYSSLLDAVTAASSKALAPGAGDTLEFVCSGAKDTTTSEIYIDIAYAGLGKIVFQGDHTEGPKFNGAKYNLENSSNSNPFQFMNCADIDFKGFQYGAIRDAIETNIFKAPLGSTTDSTIPNITATDCYFKCGEKGGGSQAYEAIAFRGGGGSNLPTNTHTMTFTNTVIDGHYNDLMDVRYLTTFTSLFINCTFPPLQRMLAYATATTSDSFVFTDCIFDQPQGHPSVHRATLNNCAYRLGAFGASTNGVVDTNPISLGIGSFNGNFVDASNDDYTAIDSAPLSGAGISGGLVGSYYPVAPELYTHLLTQIIDLTQWLAGSGGVVRGNDKPGDL